MKIRVFRCLAACCIVSAAGVISASPAQAQGGEDPADGNARAVLLREANIALTGHESTEFSFAGNGACSVMRVRDGGAENESVEIFHLDRLPAGGIEIDARHGNQKNVAVSSATLRLHGAEKFYENRYPRRDHRDAAFGHYHTEIPVAQIERVRAAWRFLAEHGCRYGGPPTTTSN